MALPTPAKADVVAPTTSAPTVAATGETTKAAIKQFGPAKDANDVVIPAPAPLGINLVELAKTLFNTVKTELDSKAVDVNAFLSALELNKEEVPGHKEGRIAYGMANAISNIFKYVGLANKERGAGGFAKMKADIAKKDSQVNKLREQLIKLGMKPEDVDAQLAD